jgi:hypothetical protein
MNEVEIKNLQNVAQNMIVGSKQHALFKPVLGNNPPLLSCSKQASEHKPESGVEVVRVEVDDEGAKMEIVAMDGDVQGGMDAPKDTAPSGLNSHLYGPLTPCPKQFMSGKS